MVEEASITENLSAEAIVNRDFSMLGGLERRSRRAWNAQRNLLRSLTFSPEKGEQIMPDFVTEMKKELTMSSKEENIRYAIGAAAAATAIFAPVSYAWKGVLAAVAAETILTGIYGVSPFRQLT